MPGWIEVVYDPLSPFDFHVTVVISDFQEFEVRITLIPKIEEAISVHQLLGLPFHPYVF